jgi:hypothetical protein
MQTKVIVIVIPAIALSGCIKLSRIESSPLPSLNELGANMASTFSPLPPADTAAEPETPISREDSQPESETPGAEETPGVDKKLVNDLLQYYDPKQPRQALHNLLGNPSYSEPGRDVWEVADTSDGVMAPTRFIVNYDADGNSVSWYKFGGLRAGLHFELAQIM